MSQAGEHAASLPWRQSQASPRNAWHWMLGAALLIGAASAVSGQHLAALGLCTLISNLAANFLLFLWYCRDGNLRGFGRSIWWNIGMVTFASVLVFPLYLWRTRASGSRLRAVGLAILCALLLMLVMLGGAALGILAAAIIAS